MEDEYTINGRLLKNCSDALLFAVWDGLCGSDDPTEANGGLRCGIESEVVTRRHMRAASPFREPIDRFPR